MHFWVFACSVLTLLIEHQEGNLACKTMLHLSAEVFLGSLVVHWPNQWWLIRGQFEQKPRETKAERETGSWLHVTSLSTAAEIPLCFNCYKCHIFWVCTVPCLSGYSTLFVLATGFVCVCPFCCMWLLSYHCINSTSVHASALTRLGDRKGIWPVKKWVLVCWCWWFHWSFARVTAPVVTTTCIILSLNKTG